MISALDEESEVAILRGRLARLRQELTDATLAYRKALDEHDSQNVIRLLRSRSRLMRQLLDTQCELLLSLRSQTGASRPLMADSDEPFLKEAAAV